MNKRSFPLPLSSVLGDKKKTSTVSRASDERRREAAPQTGMQNLIDNREHAGFKHEARRPARAGLPVLTVGTSTPALSLRPAQAMAEKLKGLGIHDPQVLHAMSVIPRHLFVDEGLSQQAYADASLPIGYQQTISRPYTVARMIEAVRKQEGRLKKVLEIGTGCGYQAAVLSQLADEVYSIERIKGLHELAKNNLRMLRIPNLRLQYGDGMLGLPSVAPFDAIVIAAAGLEVPEALFAQLKIGGHLIAPVGSEKQTLQLTRRTGERQWQSVMLEDCHFVPLRQGVI